MAWLLVQCSTSTHKHLTYLMYVVQQHGYPPASAGIILSAQTSYRQRLNLTSLCLHLFTPVPGITDDEGQGRTPPPPSSTLAGSAAVTATATAAASTPEPEVGEPCLPPFAVPERLHGVMPTTERQHKVSELLRGCGCESVRTPMTERQHKVSAPLQGNVHCGVTTKTCGCVRVCLLTTEWQQEVDEHVRAVAARVSVEGCRWGRASHWLTGFAVGTVPTLTRDICCLCAG